MNNKKWIVGLLLVVVLVASIYKVDIINLQADNSIQVKQELSSYKYMIDVYKGLNTDAYFTIFIGSDIQIVK